MQLIHGASYRVLKEGAYLERYAIEPNGQPTYFKVDLSVGQTLVYVGDAYDAVDYDVIPMPYFGWENEHYVFQPSSFSGLIPAGWLEPVG